MAKHKHEEHENHERWLVSYADFITLLFAFFVVMYSISSVNEGRFRAVSDSIQAALKPVVSSPASTKVIAIGDKSTSVMPVISKKAQIVRKLKDVLGSKNKQLNMIEHVNVIETEAGIKVAISDNMMFESGQAELKAQAFPLLEAMAETLNDHGMKDLRVLGHTDNVPMRTAQFPSNWELSSARAVTVVRALSELYHVPADKMSAAGYAEYKPVADNLTPENRALNRRVELIIVLDQETTHTLLMDNALGEVRPAP
ncbi:MAG: flagellar motor protein MotB [Nitrospiraceae bacterium]